MGALQRQFGNFSGADLLRTELNNRSRRSGESLRQLANDIESLTRRAYSTMPPVIQSELARDRFMQALSPPELRVEVQLTHPHSLHEALERALEKETVRAYGTAPTQEYVAPVVRAATSDAETCSLPGGAPTTKLHHDQAMLGLWRTVTPAAFLPEDTGEPGKQRWVCIEGTLRTPNPGPPHTPSNMAGQGGVAVVDRTSVGDLCHVPVTIEGVWHW